MRPGFPEYWRSLTRVQQNRIREYVEEYLGPGEWAKIKQWMNGQQRNARLKEHLRESCASKDFMLSMTEKLSDHSSVVVLAPQEGLTSTILFLAKMGWSPETIADLTGVDKAYVERIARPEAVASCDAATLEDSLKGILGRRALGLLCMATHRKSLSIRELLSILKVCYRMRKRAQSVDSKMSETRDFCT